MIFIHNFVILYLGLIIIGIGTQAGVAVFWSFPTRYLTVGAAAAAIGLINAFGGLGGFVGPYAIGDIKTATGSFYLAYSLVLVSFVLAIIFMLILNNMDKKENAANKNKKAK
jgi:nitrate/nitrite transporter NarK